MALALTGPACAQVASAVPLFVEKACDIPGVSADMAPRLRCGTVAVPRDEPHPGLDRFDLAVVVVKSDDPTPRPDPVLYISGGPGSPLTMFADYQGRHPYAPDRDLILVDQRGTGRSQPKLCPDLDRELLDASLAVASDPSAGTRARSRELHLACRDEAMRRGIDLADFGTTVTVEDLERVRQALGVARWNVFGVSYGTTVAMTLLASHPDTVRSAVLDSLYPPDPYLPPWSKRVADAIEGFLAFCGRDGPCASAYPDLAGTYRDALARLASNPLVATLDPDLGSPGGEVRLTPSLFETVVGLLVYYRDDYPTIAAAHRFGPRRRPSAVRHGTVRRAGFGSAWRTTSG